MNTSRQAQGSKHDTCSKGFSTWKPGASSAQRRCKLLLVRPCFTLLSLLKRAGKTPHRQCKYSGAVGIQTYLSLDSSAQRFVIVLAAVASISSCPLEPMIQSLATMTSSATMAMIKLTAPMMMMTLCPSVLLLRARAIMLQTRTFARFVSLF